MPEILLLIALGCGLLGLCGFGFFHLFRRLKHVHTRGAAGLFYLLTGAIGALPWAVAVLLAALSRQTDTAGVDIGGCLGALMITALMLVLVQRSMLSPPATQTDQLVAALVFGGLITAASLTLGRAVSGHQNHSTGLIIVSLMLNTSAMVCGHHLAVAGRERVKGNTPRSWWPLALMASLFIVLGIGAGLAAAGFFSGEVVSATARGNTGLKNIAVIAVAIAIGCSALQWTSLYLTGLSQEREQALLGSLDMAAARDEMTKLPNRKAVEKAMDEAIKACSANQELFSLILVRIGPLKEINSTHGFALGDAVIMRSIDALQGVIGKGDVLGRISGDLFALVSLECNSPAGASERSQAITSRFETPMRAGNLELQIHSSVGVAMFPRDGQTIDDLFTHAHVAANNARRLPGSQTVFYSNRLTESLRTRAELQGQLRKAISNAELSIHLQPQFDLESGRLIGAEALLRWHDENGRVRPPSEFIPLAEETGLIRPIGKFVLESACQQVQKWLDMGCDAVPISVNVSAAQFEQPDFVEVVTSTVERHFIDAKWIHLELTESLAMSNAEATALKLNQLRENGFQFSLDDFGTGYSSLAYLSRFRFNQIKIDRSFVSHLPEHPHNQHIVQAIVMLAKPLGMKVIAEGVETEAEAQWLRLHDCEQVQGYFYGRPVTLPEFDARWMQKPSSEKDSAPSELLAINA